MLKALFKVIFILWELKKQWMRTLMITSLTQLTYRSPFCGNTNFLNVGLRRKGNFMILLGLWDRKLRSKWNLVVVYGAHEEHKDLFLSVLSKLCHFSKDPLLIGCDFYVIRYAGENNKGFAHKKPDLFKAVIHAYELREIPIIWGEFTWI
jgi:hypothetical protein